MKLSLAFLVVAVLAACSAGAPGSSGSTGPSGTPSASPSESAPGPSGVSLPIDSVEEAIAAVVAEDPSFTGYEPLDPNLIGQSAWVDVERDGDAWLLTFVRGWGDCPAGCINRAYSKFRVAPDGTVEARCQWQTGEEAIGTPC